MNKENFIESNEEQQIKEAIKSSIKKELDLKKQEKIINEAEKKIQLQNLAEELNIDWII